MPTSAQLRKWIRNADALERALPTTKCLAPQARHDGAASDDEASSQASVPTLPNSPSVSESETRVPTAPSFPPAATPASTPMSYGVLYSPVVQLAKAVPVYSAHPFSSDSRCWISTALLRGSNDVVRMALPSDPSLLLPHSSLCNAMRRPVIAVPVAHHSSGVPPQLSEASMSHDKQSERAVAMELINMSFSNAPALSTTSSRMLFRM
ncbi:MAG: hypothetical protein SGPRY_003446 [Prymnesium sp.]